jgi:hypothetical protein
VALPLGSGVNSAEPPSAWPRLQQLCDRILPHTGLEAQPNSNFKSSLQTMAIDGLSGARAHEVLTIQVEKTGLNLIQIPSSL